MEIIKKTSVLQPANSNKGRSHKKTRRSTALNPKKRFSCEKCRRSFKARANLLIHNRIHTGEKPYTCEECGKSFNQQSHIIAHSRVHSGEKPYTCKECDKSFNQQSHIIAHYRLHTGEKPYTCKECGKSFRQQSNLIFHNRVHMGETPYTCKKCGKTFARSDVLTLHLKRHHAGTRRRGILGKTINGESVSTNLSNLPVETLYKCQKCSKRFTLRIAFNRHVCPGT